MQPEISCCAISILWRRRSRSASLAMFKTCKYLMDEDRFNSPVDMR
jgi:hypothetical protein